MGGGGGGRLFEAGRLLTFSAFRMGAYSRWALIRGWALIRINTVLCNIFLVARANVSILMLVSLCKDLKMGETGLRANCLPNLLEQELQRNPFRRILLSPQQPFHGSLNR